MVQSLLRKNNMKYISQKKGFTLVEMIVSLAVFMVVAVIAVGALLKITDANRKSQSLKTAINNINYTLDAMSREIRTGRNMVLYNVNGRGNYSLYNGTNEDYPSADGNNTGLDDEWIIVFESTKNNTDTNNPCKLKIGYKFASHTTNFDTSNIHTIQRAEQFSNDIGCDGQLGLLNNGPEDDFVDILSPDVQITNSIVDVDTSGGHGKASFWFKGYAGKTSKDRTDFEIQTTVSQRN